MKSIRLVMIAAVTLLTVQSFAMPQDYFFSIYGKNAKKYFDKLPRQTSTCAYIENAVDAQGNTLDTIKLEIQGQQINSILCHLIGEQTYACEASTSGSTGCSVK
ncbi:MAG: hypothetical protein ACXWRA_08665 [Pseudobdellovibrionaceae bacterium]